MLADRDPTAAALSVLPVLNSDERTSSPSLHSIRPPWSQERGSRSFSRSSRRSLSSSRVFSAGAATGNMQDQAINTTRRIYQRAVKSWGKMTFLQKILAVLAGIVSVACALGFMVLTGKIFEWLQPVAEDWEKSVPPYIILWLLTVVVSFPPLVGWSAIGTVCGYLFGVWKGWFLFASGSVIGSTFSFIVSRTILSNYVRRLMERDKRFAALALTLKYDGLKLLCMIRLCPLPYSICNGAVSTFPTVHPLMYGLATAIISPKFLISTFVGSRLRILSRTDEEMSAGAKALNVISLIVSICVGIFTGLYIYKRTLARAKQLEAEERASLRRSSLTDPAVLPSPSTFTDDPDVTTPLRDEEERVGFQDDAVALDVDDLVDARSYRDEFTDNDSDVFDAGDGESVEEVYTLHRHVDSR
ncbi:hypothetical protein VTO42DRAFT_447 [Malbranchea cinnamomea]